MAFSFLVELLNISLVRKEKKRRIVRLNEPVLDEDDDEKESDIAH
jgi:hypothetical protein